MMKLSVFLLTSILHYCLFCIVSIYLYSCAAYILFCVKSSLIIEYSNNEKSKNKMRHFLDNEMMMMRGKIVKVYKNAKNLLKHILWEW